MGFRLQVLKVPEYRGFPFQSPGVVPCNKAHKCEQALAVAAAATMAIKIVSVDVRAVAVMRWGQGVVRGTAGDGSAHAPTSTPSSPAGGRLGGRRY